MSDLVQYKPSYGLMLAPEKVAALSALIPSDKKIIEASLTGPIKSAEYIVTIPKLINILTATFLKAGQDPKDLLNIYAQELYNTLVEKYPLVTVEEVGIALRNGVYDEYGDYFGLNPKSFLFFIRSYLFSRERQAARDRYNTAKQIQAPRAPEIKYHEDASWTDDITEVWKDITQRFYTWYLEDNPLYDATSEGCYWVLKRAGKITVTPEYQQRLISRGKVILRSQTIKSGKHPDDIARILKLIDEQKDRDIAIQTRAIGKRVAVLNFFQKQKKKNITQLFQDESIHAQ